MSFEELRELWRTDAVNYVKVVNKKTIFKLYLTSAGFKYCFLLRLSTFFAKKNKLIYRFLIFRLQHFSYKFGIEIFPQTKIGKGLTIAHFGGIVIHEDAVIGENFNIRTGVIIGMSESGVPTIGDNVYVGVGAKIIGNVKIGNNVKIGANAVVLKDVPDNCTAVGVPAKIIYPKNQVVNS